MSDTKRTLLNIALAIIVIIGGVGLTTAQSEAALTGSADCPTTCEELPCTAGPSRCAFIDCDGDSIDDVICFQPEPEDQEN